MAEFQLVSSFRPTGDQPQAIDGLVEGVKKGYCHQALPERVTAAWNRMLGGTITGVDPRNNQPYVDISFLWSKGGSGATYGVDGYDHIGLICCAGGLLAQDYEMMELHDPHLLLYHEYATDSAGPGCWRGGLGTDTAFQIYGQEIQAVIYGDGVDEGAFGLFGGKEGTVNSMELVLPCVRQIRFGRKSRMASSPWKALEGTMGWLSIPRLLPSIGRRPAGSGEGAQRLRPSLLKLNRGMFLFYRCEEVKLWLI